MRHAFKRLLTLKAVIYFTALYFMLLAVNASCQEEAAAPAETIPFAYLILDASSSMWGRIDERPKIELAKEVLVKIINKLPQKVNTGFTVYGHRRANDCQDIEDLSEPGIMEKSEIIGKIKKITPRGKSPLSATIQHVLNKIKTYEGPKTIILVSDGVESCGQDPCKLVAELKEQKIDFKIEVIGLNVSDEESKQLTCIAETSGGAYQYITAASQIDPPPATPTAEVFPTAVPPPAEQVVISDTTQSYLEEGSVATPESVVLNNPVPTPFKLVSEKVLGTLAFEYDSWLNNPHYWRLIDPSTGDEVIKRKSLETTEAPVGEYLLAWRQYEHGSTEVIIDQHVIIEAGKTTSVPLHTALRLNLPNWVRPPRFWGLRDLETDEQIAAFTPFETFLVAPGEYDLIWRQYENRADTMTFGRVEVEQGKVNYFTIGSSVTPRFAEWVNVEPYYWGLKVPDSDEYIARFYGSLEAQIVPEGRYTVVYRLTANESTDSVLGAVDVIEGENSDFMIDTGVVFEIKNKEDLPQSMEFQEIDSGGNVLNTVRLSNSLGPVPLPPGTYKLNYIRKKAAPDGKTLDTDLISLKQGELIKINLDDLFHDASVAAKQDIPEKSEEQNPLLVEPTAEPSLPPAENPIP